MKVVDFLLGMSHVSSCYPPYEYDVFQSAEGKRRGLGFLMYIPLSLAFIYLYFISINSKDSKMSMVNIHL